VDERVLVTGGTGSFGRECVSHLLKTTKSKVVVFSRDELKQWEMRQEFDDLRLRFFVGDVRDKDRLKRAFYGVTTVIHAAALKQVPTAEYNPFEVVKTNIIGSQNVIEAAIDCGVESVVCLSTDKACNPVNLYGATKLCMEKLFINGNAYSGGRPGRTRFSVVRYGNVWGSRGSVIELFKRQAEEGTLTLTHPSMTRFFITLPEAVKFVLYCVDVMQGGETFVPKIDKMCITDIAKQFASADNIRATGIRPGEKLHETLITKEEGRRTYDCGAFYVIEPEYEWWERIKVWGKKVPEGFVYRSGGE